MTKSARALAVALVTLFAAWTGATATPAVAAGSTAVVVIDSPQGQRSAVIHFDGSISGIDALQLAGGHPQVAGYAGVGGAVCMIDDYGNDQTQGVNCLVGPGSQYWAYFRSHDGASGWAYSSVGGGATTVRDGDVEGWRYGVGQPPRLSASFCAHVACPPPPTDPPPPPPATASPVVPPPPPAVGDPGTTATAAPTTVPNTKSKQADGAPAAEQDTAGDTSGAAGSEGKAGDDGDKAGRSVSTRRAGDDDRDVALGPTSSDDGGSGSPLGVLIVVGVLVAVTAVFLVQRRRTRPSNTS